MKLKLNTLFVDSAYQRGPVAFKKIFDMAKNWDDVLAQQITVGRRTVNGTARYFVIDGQQRVLAACLAGRNEIEARIIDDLTFESEAELFYRLNTERTSMVKRDVFRGRLVAGEPIARDIEAICKNFGLSIRGVGTKPSPLFVNCPSTLEEAYHAGVLEQTLLEIRTIWPKEGDAYTRAMIGGFSWILFFYASEYLSQRSDIRHKLQKYLPHEIMANARLHKGLQLNRDVSRAILSIINLGKQNKWPDKLERHSERGATRMPKDIAERIHNLATKMRR